MTFQILRIEDGDYVSQFPQDSHQYPQIYECSGSISSPSPPSWRDTAASDPTSQSICLRTAWRAIASELWGKTFGKYRSLPVVRCYQPLLPALLMRAVHLLGLSRFTYMSKLFFIAPLAKCSSSWALAFPTLSLHSLAVFLHSCQIACPCFPACAFSSHSPVGAAGLSSAMPVSCLQHQSCIDPFTPVSSMGKQSPTSYCLGNEDGGGLWGGKRASS